MFRLGENGLEIEADVAAQKMQEVPQIQLRRYCVDDNFFQEGVFTMP